MTAPETRATTNGGGAPSDQPGTAGRIRSVPHPRHTLSQAEDLARTAFGMGARHCDIDAVAQAVGYKSANNGAFKGLKAAAMYFGLVTYDDRFLSVTDPWIEALHHDDQAELRRLRQTAVGRPDLYQQLIDELAEKQLPPAEKLGRQLHLLQKYGILKDAAEGAAQVFLESVAFAGLVDTNNFLRLNGLRADAPPMSSPGAAPTAAQQHTVGGGSGRERAPSTQRSEPRFADTPNSGEGLDRIEVQLAGGKRAYLFVPVPLQAREKERLKKYIDLILEPEDENSSPPASDR
jgi:hypothetical protein